MTIAKNKYEDAHDTVSEAAMSGARCVGTREGWKGVPINHLRPRGPTSGAHASATIAREGEHAGAPRTFMAPSAQTPSSDREMHCELHSVATCVGVDFAWVDNKHSPLAQVQARFAAIEIARGDGSDEGKTRSCDVVDPRTHRAPQTRKRAQTNESPDARPAPNSVLDGGSKQESTEVSQQAAARYWFTSI